MGQRSSNLHQKGSESQKPAPKASE